MPTDDTSSAIVTASLIDDTSSTITTAPTATPFYSVLWFRDDEFVANQIILLQTPTPRPGAPPTPLPTATSELRPMPTGMVTPDAAVVPIEIQSGQVLHVKLTAYDADGDLRWIDLADGINAPQRWPISTELGEIHTTLSWDAPDLYRVLAVVGDEGGLDNQAECLVRVVKEMPKVQMIWPVSATNGTVDAMSKVKQGDWFTPTAKVNGDFQADSKEVEACGRYVFACKVAENSEPQGKTSDDSSNADVYAIRSITWYVDGEEQSCQAVHTCTYTSTHFVLLDDEELHAVSAILEDIYGQTERAIWNVHVLPKNLFIDLRAKPPEQHLIFSRCIFSASITATRGISSCTDIVSLEWVMPDGHKVFVPRKDLMKNGAAVATREFHFRETGPFSVRARLIGQDGVVLDESVRSGSVIRYDVAAKQWVEKSGKAIQGFAREMLGADRMRERALRLFAWMILLVVDGIWLLSVLWPLLIGGDIHEQPRTRYPRHRIHRP